MIKIKKHYNIYDIIYKIEKFPINEDNKIVLEIPFGHPILYNYLALKSIKNRIGDKKLIIITADFLASKVGKSLGIKYTIIKDKNFIENKKNILKYNYTFLEYFKYEIKSYSNLFFSMFKKNNSLNKLSRFYSKQYKQKSYIFIFLLLLTISLSIFFYIFYFTLNKTEVVITPAIKIQTKSKNFTFSENDNQSYLSNKNEKLIKIEKKIDLKLTFKTTGIKQDENYKAKGKIKLINKLDTEVKLLPNTRLVSPNGLTYETLEWITLPAAQKNNIGKLIPGTKEAEIIARLKDEKGAFIGKRGNLSSTGVILILPGLKDDKDKIYAKTLTPLEGGKDEHINIVAQDDKESATNIMEEKLRKKAVEEIDKELISKNEANNITYQVLGINDIYTFSNSNITFGDNFKVGDEINSFNLSGSINVSTYAYNANSIISKLKSEIEESIVPDKEKILYINDKTIRISNIIEQNTKPFKIKATIEIETVLSHNFENESDNYVKRLKGMISGMNKDEAEKILINEDKINNAKIEIRPFFLHNISNFLDNISFTIEE